MKILQVTTEEGKPKHETGREASPLRSRSQGGFHSDLDMRKLADLCMECSRQHGDGGGRGRGGEKLAERCCPAAQACCEPGQGQLRRTAVGSSRRWQPQAEVTEAWPRDRAGQASPPAVTPSSSRQWNTYSHNRGTRETGQVQAQKAPGLNAVMEVETNV